MPARASRSGLWMFQRPVCYQNFPPELLPDAVRDDNPHSVARRLNGEPQL